MVKGIRQVEPKAYLVVCNYSGDTDLVSSLHQYIMNSKDLIAYWNYIPLVYIVKSYNSLPELRDKFKSILGKHQFLIAEISGAHLDGFLPKAAWDWFYHSHGQLSLAHIMGLGGLGALGGLAENPPKK